MTNQPLLLTVLRGLTRLIPPLPHASGLSNRIVKPFYNAFHRGRVTIPVWGGMLATVDPADAMGGNLCFIPHLYDRWERRLLSRYLRPDSVFVDVGANIGAYSLWAGLFVSEGGTIVSIEADPDTFRTLTANLECNRLRARLVPLQVGVSDRPEVLWIRRSTTNAAGNTLIESENSGPSVPCKTLYAVLEEAGIRRVDFLKVDVEGMDLKVLRKYFEETASHPDMHPALALVEILEGPAAKRPGYMQEMIDMFASNGYDAVEHRMNSLFRRRQG
jgi:FkbM family methyltransferase